MKKLTFKYSIESQIVKLVNSIWGFTDRYYV